MVELTLDLVEQASMPEDCFVSVRIGDSQKLSRLADSRIYRFPKLADKRYGRIEVFQRIGSCTVDVDPTSQVSRDRPVNVNCQDSGFGRLALRVGVEADPAAKEKIVADTEAKGKKHSTKVKAAKEYLGKHGLEVMLSEAMQVVLRERPENPCEFIGRRLLSESTVSPRATSLPFVNPNSKPCAPMPESRKPLPAEPPVVPLASRAQPKLSPLTGRQQPTQQSTFPMTTACTSNVGAEALVPFARYYKTHFSTIRLDNRMPLLYAAFPAPTTVKAFTQQARQLQTRGERIVPFKTYYPKHFGRVCVPPSLYTKFPTSGTRGAARLTERCQPFAGYYQAHMVKACADAQWSAFYDRNSFTKPEATSTASCAPSIVPFGAYYKAHVRECGACLWPSLHAKFGTQNVTSTRVGPTDRTSPPKPCRASFLPSVGTWLARPPKSHREPAPTAPAAPFVFRPSVGTWLTTFASKDTSPAFEPQLVESSVMLPSVGTWLAKPVKLKTTVVEDTATVSFPFRPSVGTWLMTARTARESRPQRPRRAMVSEAILHGSSFYSSNLRPGLRVI